MKMSVIFEALFARVPSNGLGAHSASWVELIWKEDETSCVITVRCTSNLPHLIFLTGQTAYEHHPLLYFHILAQSHCCWFNRGQLQAPSHSFHYGFWFVFQVSYSYLAKRWFSNVIYTFISSWWFTETFWSSVARDTVRTYAVGTPSGAQRKR